MNGPWLVLLRPSGSGYELRALYKSIRSPNSRRSRIVTSWFRHRADALVSLKVVMR
jgi:hypothetical protein